MDSKATSLPIFPSILLIHLFFFFHYSSHSKYCPFLKAKPTWLYINKDFLDHPSGSILPLLLVPTGCLPLTDLPRILLCSSSYFWMSPLPECTVSHLREMLLVKSIRPFCSYHGPGTGLNVSCFVCTSHSLVRWVPLSSALCRGRSGAQRGNLLKVAYVNAYNRM